MNLKQGTFLQGGKYRIERELGHGGFGVTYLATQVGLNRRVAIKEFFMSEYCERDADTSQVSLGTSGSRDTVERFKKKFVKEAQNIACLKHPHIISIHDVFEDNGTAYYVMEYLEYGSLADLVKRQGRLSEADALRYTRQIADALRYIHARKMNHLDVKPGNILIDEADHAVLIDFGLSKRYDDEGNQTSTTPVGISHGYAPLEQYKKSGVGTFSPATDIYSLGATLYKLVTGTTPPDANDVSEDGLPALPSYVSSTIAAAIEQAMQPRRKNRPQTVEAFLALLEAPVVEDEATVLEPDVNDDVNDNKHGDLEPDGRSTSTLSSTLKRLIIPAIACVVTALVIFLWPIRDGGLVGGKDKDEVPSWVKGVADKGLWLGVSPPTEDMDAARNMALQNAVLYYLCANGGGTLQTIYAFEEDIWSKQGGESFEEQVNSSMDEAIKLVFDNFSIQTVHEYYNSRGECFVACKISQSKSTGNSMTVSRTWSEDSEKAVGKVDFDVIMHVDGKDMKSGLDVSYGKDGTSYVVTSGNAILSGMYNWKYPKMRMSATQNNYGYELDINQPFGVTQMVCMAVSPFVSDTMSVMSTDVPTLEEHEGVSELKKHSIGSIFTNGKNKGLGFVMHSFRQGVLDVAMKKFSEKDYLSSDFMYCDGASTFLQGRPLLLSKMKAYYQALHLASGEILANIPGERVYDTVDGIIDKHIGVTNNKILVHAINWNLDGEPLPSQEELVGVLIQEVKDVVE